VQFSIITPSFRQSDLLKLCVASVADQGVEAEHIIQDAGSDDGTLDWLVRDSRVKAFVEKDSGMYDAVNRGFRRASSEILAWLNCDEQYLSGALKAVAEFFRVHPDVDILFGDVVMIDPAGKYLYHRKIQTPLLYHTWLSHLSTLSCAMFFRRRVVFGRNEFLNPDWRSSGDAEWMLRLLQQNIRMARLGQFTSAFTQTGANLSAAESARRENRMLAASAPAWARAATPLFILHHRLRRLLGGMYFQKPFSFEIFTPASPAKRVTQFVPRPSFRRS
jgi:glycosyltransferase involved in cell wall biosynthesis